MRTLLLMLAMLVSYLPSQDFGKPLSTVPVDGGTCTLYERGMIYDAQGWTLSYSLDGKPMVLHAEWETQTAAGTITVSVSYELPVANPSPTQMRKYAKRFQAMVATQMDIFPPLPQHGGT